MNPYGVPTIGVGSIPANVITSIRTIPEFPPGPAATQVSPLEILDKGLAGLNDAITTLENRLSSVLRPETPTSNQASPHPGEPVMPIRVAISRVQGASERLERILSRIDL